MKGVSRSLAHHCFSSHSLNAGTWNMEDTALAKQIYNQQLKYGLPGLIKEGVKYCKELGIPDVTKVKASEMEFKWMVKKTCRLRDEEELKLNIIGKEKLQLLREGDCRLKDYLSNMSLSEVRILFGHKTRMTKNAQNYKKLPKYAGEGAKCKFCLQYNSYSHLMRCKAFSHLRSDEFCLNNDLHLVKYLRQVLKLREEKEQKEQKDKMEQKDQKKQKEQ